MPTTLSRRCRDHSGCMATVRLVPRGSANANNQAQDWADAQGIVMPESSIAVAVEHSTEFGVTPGLQDYQPLEAKVTRAARDRAESDQLLAGLADQLRQAREEISGLKARLDALELAVVRPDALSAVRAGVTAEMVALKRLLNLKQPHGDYATRNEVRRFQGAVDEALATLALAANARLEAVEASLVAMTERLDHSQPTDFTTVDGRVDKLEAAVESHAGLLSKMRDR